jgi:hypothetical protein
VIPSAVGIVTAITIILIGAIVTVYLSILKRNGWIGNTSNYRCPNPQCRKIFQTPMKVKDLSKKSEAHLACPECGFDLGLLNAEKSLEIAIESKQELKKESVSKPIEKQVPVTKDTVKEVNALENPSITIEPKQNTSPQKINKKSIPKQKEADPKKDRPAGCNYHFGYLGSLPKGTETPDECYSCTRLIECFK